MKIKLNIKVAILFWIVLLSGCGGGGGGSSDNDPGNPPPTVTVTKVYVNIEDAVAGNIWTDVNLNFSGTSVKDEASSNPISEKVLSAEDSKSFTLLVEGESESNVIVTAQALGYLDTGSSILVSPNSGHHELNLKMVPSSPGKVTDGIYNAEMEIGAYLDSTGTTTQQIDLTSKDLTDTNDPGPGVSISIPANTTLWAIDSDGNKTPVTDGTLRVTSFDPYASKSVSAFPGGFNVIANADNFIDSDQNSYSGDAEINFKSAGFAAISIQSDSGTKVKEFSQDVTISMEVKDGTTDVKGNSIVGSSIPVWSYDESAGKWDFEDNSSAITGASGGFGKVSIDSSHLSYWNLDWHYGPKCAPRFDFLLPDGTPDLGSYKFRLIIGSNPSIDRWSYNYQNDGFLELNNVPANVSGSLEIYVGNALVHTVSVDNFCDSTNSGNSYVGNDFQVEIPPPPLLDTPVTMSFACPTGLNIPGTNSNSVPFEALLAPNNGSGNVALDQNGQGTVSIGTGQTVSFTSVPNTLSQQTLYSAVADPATATFDVVGTNPATPVNIVLQLSEAYCTPNPLGIATINGADTNNIGEAVCSTGGDIDGDLSSTPGKDQLVDLVRSANGDIYFSTRKGPDMNEGSLKRWPAPSTDPNLIETVIGYGTNAYPDHYSMKPASTTSAWAPWGLDLHLTTEGEVLYYADRYAHCVNALYLSTMEVTTVAGECGNASDEPAVEGSKNSKESRLRYPTDVAADNRGNILYITDNGNYKVRMLSNPLADGLALGHKIRLTNPQYDDQIRLVTIAGTGNNSPIPATNLPNGDYTDGDSALTTKLGAAWLDVAPDNTVVISGNQQVSRIYDITSLSGQLLNPKLEHVAGAYEDAGSNLSQFKHPNDVEIDIGGNVFIADFSNHRVKMVDVSNNNALIPAAGNGIHSWSPTCGVATQQATSLPRGIWIEKNGGSHQGTLHDFIFTQYGDSVPNWIRQVRY